MYAHCVLVDMSVHIHVHAGVLGHLSDLLRAMYAYVLCVMYTHVH